MDTRIVEVVSAVDHNKFIPVAVNVEDPQPSTTVATGAAGIATGMAVTAAGRLVHPATVSVTVYTPPTVTTITGVVSVVDHTKLDPDVVNVELPQPSTTVTTGEAGIAVGFAIPVPGALIQPAIV